MALALAGALLRLGRPARAPDIGVANWSVEVADFQVGVARATPKVYKVTPLHITEYCSALATNFFPQRWVSRYNATGSRVFY